MHAASAVAVLVGAAKLEVDLMSAEKMKKIVTLDKSIAEFGVRNAGTVFADTVLNELAVK